MMKYPIKILAQRAMIHCLRGPTRAGYKGPARFDTQSRALSACAS